MFLLGVEQGVLFVRRFLQVSIFFPDPASYISALWEAASLGWFEFEVA